MKWFTTAIIILWTLLPLHGADLSNGTMLAVPVPDSGSPVIDGSLADWDLSAAEDVWIAAETADRLRASIVAMYDAEALYLAAQVRLPGRALRNPNSPIDPFWRGDCLQFRFISDPKTPYPAIRDAVGSSDRVNHLSLWKDTQANRDYLQIDQGINFDQGRALNPPGSAVVIKPVDGGYIMEARIPWSVLKVPGGKNPFRPGEQMTFVSEILWDHTTLRVGAIYRKNPGVFAFKNISEWGRLEFSPVGHLAPRHQTLDELLKESKVAGADAMGVPIEVTLDTPMKVSLNILGENGEVLRELTGGEMRPAGKSVWHWDGLDQWGKPLLPGKYHWSAYLSPGLKAHWVGTVGLSGEPPYPTEDGKGGWGGDHGDPVDVAADATGLYFLWMWAEEGCALVKTDFNGRVIWRKTPFVGGGFGPFYNLAANGKYVYFTFGRERSELGRLDAASGKLLRWPEQTMIPVAQGKPAQGKGDDTPFEPSSACGLAANDREVFVSAGAENRIRVFDAETGGTLREIVCASPRGIALDAKGGLYAISAPEGGPGCVLQFRNGQGNGRTVVEKGLLAPWDVAVDREGLLHVTDCGASQQVKVFSEKGNPLRTLGQLGGRPWAGKYDTSSFRNPSGIAADSQGGILVSESSLPKPISRFSAKNGTLVHRWFGSTSYGPTNIPDPDDPRVNYYSISSDPRGLIGGGFARARIPDEGGSGMPDAYWNLPNAGLPAAGLLLDTMNDPELVVAANGIKYMVGDTSTGRQCHGICQVKGDSILPIAYARVLDEKKGSRGIEFWSDRNGDHQVQPDELQTLEAVGGNKIVGPATTTGSMWMDRNGDLYFTTQANRILKVPSTGFDAQGVPQWDLAKAGYVVVSVLPALGDKMSTNWREGLLGVRTDCEGNLYTCFNTNVPYATPELTKSMQDGIGHTSRFNAVKFAKFDPQGKLLWMAGRKATQAAKPGEMYHFWVLGGLVNDRYIAGCSEWGQIYFYTHDGFFVDALMNDPALGGAAGPYTFGGETFSGRVHYFPKLDEVWAYTSGRAYKVEGFKGGKVEDEKRVSGVVVLDKVYDKVQSKGVRATLQIVPMENPASTFAAWEPIPSSEIQRNGAPLASVKLGYDAENLYARFHVVHPTPLKNGSDSLEMAFKGGDCVGLSLGPIGNREKPVFGDVRFLATIIQGHPRLIAFKPFTHGKKNPMRYFTPAAGESLFDYVGEVPGATVTFSPDVDGKGYTAFFSIPRPWLEFPLAGGKEIVGDAEVLLSGQGARGLQVMSRNYLFSPTNSQTSMVDDVATESRLYPQYWGRILVK
ncbi:MAG: FlgD immunoglobulin-like domain containing protein [Chthoniobacteraceae bacterium]